MDPPDDGAPGALLLPPSYSPTPNLRRATDGWVAEVDTATRSPRWVFERLTRAGLSRGDGGGGEGGGGGRHGGGEAFFEEPGLPPHLRARLSAYAHSGFDRGHMAAAANHRGDAGARGDGFCLSNVAPQDPALNRGYWARLEGWVRALSASRGGRWSDVALLTGPLYLPVPDAAAPAGWRYAHAALGEPGAWLPVPTHFFKVVWASRGPGGAGGPDDDAAAAAGGRPLVAAAAFVVPNAPVPLDEPLATFAVPLAAVEALSGLRLSPDGPARIADVDADLPLALRIGRAGVPEHTAAALAYAHAHAHARGGGEGGGGGGGGGGEGWAAIRTPTASALSPTAPAAAADGAGGGDGAAAAPRGRRARHLCSLESSCHAPLAETAVGGRA